MELFYTRLLLLLFQNNEILLKSIITIYQLNAKDVSAKSTSFRTTNLLISYL